MPKQKPKTTGKTEVVMLSVDEIQPSPFQPRETFDKEKIRELADSINKDGLLQPILVRPYGDGYQIIAGERRWKAHTMAGLKKIPAIVKNVPDDIDARVLSLAENLKRLDLSEDEKRKFVGELWRDAGKHASSARFLTIAALADAVGMKIGAVKMCLRTYRDRLDHPEIGTNRTDTELLYTQRVI